MFAPIVEPAVLTGVGPGSPRCHDPGPPVLLPYEDLKLPLSREVEIRTWGAARGRRAELHADSQIGVGALSGWRAPRGADRSAMTRRSPPAEVERARASAAFGRKRKRRRAPSAMMATIASWQARPSRSPWKRRCRGRCGSGERGREKGPAVVSGEGGDHRRHQG